jgi:hypothetical protein
MSTSLHTALKDNVMDYPRLAGYMALEPDELVFRRFNELNVRKLLYLQAELCVLERQLKHQESEYSRSKNEATTRYARDFKWLLLSGKQAEHPQLDLALRIRVVLKKDSA